MHACIWQQVTKTDLPYPCTTHTDKVFSLELQHTCSTHLSPALYCTSVKIIKNEVGCRDDTVPKTVETRRHCEED